MTTTPTTTTTKRTRTRIPPWTATPAVGAILGTVPATGHVQYMDRRGGVAASLPVVALAVRVTDVAGDPVVGQEVTTAVVPLVVYLGEVLPSTDVYRHNDGWYRPANEGGAVGA